jgi:NAD(P)H dehydrogenase (quinone)
MRNPIPRMQMLDGFNEGWIDFAGGGAHIRKGSTNIDQAVATLIHRRHL